MFAERRFGTRYAPQAIAALALLARAVPGPRTIDDAYITFRYARNLLAGHGLVYNPGEAVLGTTTPLYAVLMAGLGRLAGGPAAPFPTLALAANAVAAACACWLLCRLGRQLEAPGAGLAAALLWAVAPMSVTFDIGGMETGLTVALILAAWALGLEGRWRLAALTAALALLARPDSLLAVAPLALERLRQVWRSNPSPWREALNEAVIGLAPLGLWAALAGAYYGNPLPHSIFAKVAAYRLPPEAGLVRLLQHYSTPFLGHLTFGIPWIGVGLVLYPILFLLGALATLRRRPDAWPVFLYPWLYLATFAAANPLIFRWYLAPPLPAYFLGIFLGFRRVSQDLRRPWLLGAGVAVALALTLRGWTLHPDHGPDRPAPEMAYIRLELLYQEVAEWLRPRLEADDLLAAGDVGALGYYTGARILDTVGLVSPQALRYYPAPEEAYVINYAIPADLVLDLQPDYLVVLEAYVRNTLLQDPRFAAAYQEIDRRGTDIYGSRGLLVFRRKAP